MLRHLLVLSLFPAVGICQASPSAKDIMENYSKNAGKYNSFIGKSNSSMEFTSIPLSGKQPARSGSSYHQEEFRYDGVRGCYLDTAWGNTSLGSPVPKDNPQFTCNLFVKDGESYWYGRANSTDAGRANLSHVSGEGRQGGKQMLTMLFRGGILTGYFPGDNERIDKVLQNLQAITVRDKAEQVDSSQCYVIDAKTAGGTYTLWIDPERGYSIVQATIARKAGDKLYGKVLPDGYQNITTISNVTFVNRDGVWVPTGGQYASDIVSGKSKVHQVTRVRDLDITVNPDHDALGSFDPNGIIRDGAKVKVRNPGSNVPALYIWQERGKLVPDTAKPAVRKPRGR